MKIWKFLNHYLFNSKGANFENERFGLQFRSSKRRFLKILIVFSSFNIHCYHLTRKKYRFPIDLTLITEKAVFHIRVNDP